MPRQIHVHIRNQYANYHQFVNVCARGGARLFVCVCACVQTYVVVRYDELCNGARVVGGRGVVTPSRHSDTRPNARQHAQPNENTARCQPLQFPCPLSVSAGGIATRDRVRAAPKIVCVHTNIPAELWPRSRSVQWRCVDATVAAVAAAPSPFAGCH